MHRKLTEINKNIDIGKLVELGWSKSLHKFRDLIIYMKDEQRFLYDEKKRLAVQYYMVGKIKED